MKIICIGDSLTEGDYGVFGKSGIANVQEKNYPYFLAESMGAEVVNYGKCGFTSSSYLEFYKSGAVNVTGADVIIIMLGTNGGQTPDLNNFVQGNADYLELVELCKKDAPDAKIVLCTPPHATENSEMSNCGYAAQVKEAVEFVRMFAEKYEYALIDVAECPDFTAENESVMQPNDGVHFGEEGYRRLAYYIEKGLRNFGLLN